MRDITVGSMMGLLVTHLAVFVYRCIAFHQLKKKTFPSMVGMSAMTTSVLFTTVAATLVFFTGSGVEAVCEVATWTCLSLYMATKAQIYIFFIERMHIVHKSPSKSRIETPLYIFNMCLLLPFVGILILMIFYRVSYVGDNQKCQHGLRRESTIPLVFYDTIFSIYAIVVFVWPLFKSQSLRRSEGLRWVVKKNIIGSIVSTISTLLNGFSLFYQEVQVTDFCLLHCTADVMINVLVMNYLIGGSSGSNRKVRHEETNNNACFQNQTSVAGQQEYAESNAMSFTSKVHPINENKVCYPMSVNEATVTGTIMTATDSDRLGTVTKEEPVLEELV